METRVTGTNTLNNAAIGGSNTSVAETFLGVQRTGVQRTVVVLVLVVALEGMAGIIGMVEVAAGRTVVSVDVVFVIMGELQADAARAAPMAETASRSRIVEDPFCIAVS